MTTITIPRADYVQRADDEGRDFYTLRTIRAAAERWGAADGNGWTEVGDEAEEAPVLIFAQNGTVNPDVRTCREDSEMELYPAVTLPFTIAAQRFDVGDWIAPQTAPADRTPFRVVTVNERGTWLSHHAPWNTEDGLLTSPDYDDWKVVPAPTATFTVTVPADYSTHDVSDAVKMLVKGNVTVVRA